MNLQTGSGAVVPKRVGSAKERHEMFDTFYSLLWLPAGGSLMPACEV
jgi:hypothetical protein